MVGSDEERQLRNLLNAVGLERTRAASSLDRPIQIVEDTLRSLQIQDFPTVQSA